MPFMKLYRKPGNKNKKYRSEMRPSRIEIEFLPLLLFFAISIAVWCLATGHNRPEEETLPVDTVPPCEETVDPAESLPAESEARPSNM